MSDDYPFDEILNTNLSTTVISKTFCAYPVCFSTRVCKTQFEGVKETMENNTIWGGQTPLPGSIIAFEV